MLIKAVSTISSYFIGTMPLTTCAMTATALVVAIASVYYLFKGLDRLLIQNAINSPLAISSTNRGVLYRGLEPPDLGRFIPDEEEILQLVSSLHQASPESIGLITFKESLNSDPLLLSISVELTRLALAKQHGLNFEFRDDKVLLLTSNQLGCSGSRGTRYHPVWSWFVNVRNESQTEYLRQHSYDGKSNQYCIDASIKNALAKIPNKAQISFSEGGLYRLINVILEKSAFSLYKGNSSPYYVVIGESKTPVQVIVPDEEGKHFFLHALRSASQLNLIDEESLENWHADGAVLTFEELVKQSGPT